MDVQHCGSSVLLSVTGELDVDAGAALQHALDDVTSDERDLMVDLHGVVSMDSDGLLHLLDLHRRAEHLGLRVLVIGWQPQPQQLIPRSPASAGPDRPPVSGTHWRVSVGWSRNGRSAHGTSRISLLDGCPAASEAAARPQSRSELLP
ncbi:STAS domain-containing protein [Streptomyces sp. NPDC099050]|uniref:STAS domain-containing protein n=1 Tax=Streptomyces sp. NPDC099050 TaxID=3366100 RepID=UPI003819EC85